MLVASVILLTCIPRIFPIELPGPCPKMPASVFPDHNVEATAGVYDLVPVTSYDSYIFKKFPTKANCMYMTFTPAFETINLYPYPLALRRHFLYVSGVSRVANGSVAVNWRVWQRILHKEDSLSLCHSEKNETIRIWSLEDALGLWTCVENGSSHDEGALVILLKRNDNEMRANYDALVQRYFNSSGITKHMRMGDPIVPNSCPIVQLWPCGGETTRHHGWAAKVVVGYVLGIIFLVAVVVLVKLYLDRKNKVHVIG